MLKTNGFVSMKLLRYTLIITLFAGITGCSNARWTGIDWESIGNETARSKAQASCEKEHQGKDYFDCVGRNK